MLRVQATERKAITMNMIMNVEPENAAEAAEHRPVSCRFVVDEVRLLGDTSSAFCLSHHPPLKTCNMGVSASNTLCSV